MTDPLKHLEAIFSQLAAAGYSPRREQSGVYNCIAYAAGDETRKWEGYREVGYYWPEGASEGHTLAALMSAFEQLEYAICNSDALSRILKRWPCTWTPMGYGPTRRNNVRMDSGPVNSAIWMTLFIERPRLSLGPTLLTVRWLFS
jgi:hypothetical protein